MGRGLHSSVHAGSKALRRGLIMKSLLNNIGRVLYRLRVRVAVSSYTRPVWLRYMLWELWRGELQEYTDSTAVEHR